MVICPHGECSIEFENKGGLHSHLALHHEYQEPKLSTLMDSVDATQSRSKYPSDWQERRQDTLERDNHTCQSCGAASTDLHVHHKTPISEGGSHALENLTTLCAECHSKKHPQNALLNPEPVERTRHSPHHRFRQRLCEEYGINYETAKKYDHLHNKLVKKRLDSLFNSGAGRR